MVYRSTVDQPSLLNPDLIVALHFEMDGPGESSRRQVVGDIKRGGAMAGEGAELGNRPTVDKT